MSIFIFLLQLVLQINFSPDLVWMLVLLGWDIIHVKITLTSPIHTDFLLFLKTLINMRQSKPYSVQFQKGEFLARRIVQLSYQKDKDSTSKLTMQFHWSAKVARTDCGRESFSFVWIIFLLLFKYSLEISLVQIFKAWVAKEIKDNIYFH